MYKFYVTPNKTTIAVSTYAGKTVKGIAKLNPNDEYDESFGKMLATARCAAKVEKKRKANAQKKYLEAFNNYAKASKQLEKMTLYLNEAEAKYINARVKLTDIEAGG